MENIKKSIHYLNYDKASGEIRSLSIVKEDDHSLELELTDKERVELEENLNFAIVKNGELKFDNDYKKRYFADIEKRIKIEKLKKLLSDSDWKVIVNSELTQEGLKPKYPKLHDERQAWRDEINLLEEENEI